MSDKGKKLESLLEPIAVISVPAFSGFVAHNHLPEVNVQWTYNPTFQHFRHRVEEEPEDVNITVHLLKVSSLDNPILQELGTRTPVRLGHFFALLRAQANGEPGPLLLDDSFNIAHAMGTDGNIWAVYARYHHGHWAMTPRSLTNPCPWPVGTRILSR